MVSVPLRRDAPAWGGCAVSEGAIPVRALQAEADRVPDPGGPVKNYIDALHAWAATHPEVDPNEMGAITSPLIRDHR